MSSTQPLLSQHVNSKFHPQWVIASRPGNRREDGSKGIHRLSRFAGIHYFSFLRMTGHSVRRHPKSPRILMSRPYSKWWAPSLATDKGILPIEALYVLAGEVLCTYSTEVLRSRGNFWCERVHHVQTYLPFAYTSCTRTHWKDNHMNDGEELDGKREPFWGVRVEFVHLEASTVGTSNSNFPLTRLNLWNSTTPAAIRLPPGR